MKNTTSNKSKYSQFPRDSFTLRLQNSLKFPMLKIISLRSKALVRISITTSCSAKYPTVRWRMKITRSRNF